MYVNQFQSEILNVQPYETVGLTAQQSEDRTLKRKKLNDYLLKNRQCEDYSIPLFASFSQSVPPIFVDVEINIKPQILVVFGSNIFFSVLSFLRFTFS